ncbi:MAG: Fe-S cluster assembly protein SufB [Parcubacteria group bacterium]|nr:Fe-S cluster assembly protein SufB [Parcubacteria group bacterium]
MTKRPSQSKQSSTEPQFIDRSRYDAANKPLVKYAAAPGLTEELVREISHQKNEPERMREKRLQGFAYFQKTPIPTWGADLSRLDLAHITYFVRPDAKESHSWDDVPETIRATFEKIGIPEAERRALGGVGAQYDSDVVYHNLKKEWEEKGVIFENMDVAVEKYPDLVKKYFMTSCIPVNDHTFIMLHAAVWSGGTFIYVPPGVKVALPLQAYFRMNAERGGQFEHTLIIADTGSEVQYIEGCSAPRFDTSALHAGCVELFVHEGARIRYSSIENWSINTYNLNTKRALVDAGGVIEWVNGNLGSGTTMLYPSSILRGEGAQSHSLGVAFAGRGQYQDTGAKVIHVAPNTSSVIHAKSISRGGGVSTYRGYVRVAKPAVNARSHVICDALMLDEGSVSNTIPTMKVESSSAHISHEARVGKIGEEEIFYCRSRGLSEEEAIKMVVSGFIDPIVKRLPLEYAVELNSLIELEMEGAIG